MLDLNINLTTINKKDINIEIINGEKKRCTDSINIIENNIIH